MKIEVGKTYKDQNGQEWYVEAHLRNYQYREYPYLLTCEAPSYPALRHFSECGKSWTGECELQPNKVKRKGWVIFDPQYMTTKGLVAGFVYTYYPDIAGGAVVVPIEWEEEE